MTQEEMVAQYEEDRLNHWAAKVDMDDPDIAALVQANIKREVTEYRKSLGTKRQAELDKVTDLFKRTLIPALQKEGFLTSNGWTFSVEKDGTVNVGRIGTKPRVKVEG